MDMLGELEAVFPGLRDTDWRVTSPQDERYNCIAWAAGDDGNWGEPDPMGLYYWPAEATREYTFSAYREAFETIGFALADPESGSEEAHVALFARGPEPTHAARKLAPGRWTSKLGEDIDIEHQLDALEGKSYGTVAAILVRRPER